MGAPWAGWRGGARCFHGAVTSPPGMGQQLAEASSWPLGAAGDPGAALRGPCSGHQFRSPAQGPGSLGLGPPALPPRSPPLRDAGTAPPLRLRPGSRAAGRGAGPACPPQACGWSPLRLGFRDEQHPLSGAFCVRSSRSRRPLQPSCHSGGVPHTRPSVSAREGRGVRGAGCVLTLGFTPSGATFLVTFGNSESSEAMVCRLSSNQR